MNRKIILIVAPVAPRCFSSRDQWVEYLTSAQDHFKPSRRPFDEAQNYRPGFHFCKDCAFHYQAMREAEGRCKPHDYTAQRHADAAAKEAASAAA